MRNRSNRLFIRQGIICLGAPVLIAFVVSSPSQLAFWVVLFGVLAVIVPGLAVASRFWRDARRIQQDRS
jgi:uncharacterized membrane protein YhaH (DUF805 family)